MNIDVPSPIDLKKYQDAKQWELTANLKRPWRYDFFDYYAQKIAQGTDAQLHILELGSGPGFLGKYLLERLPNIQYTAFDFSELMHTLCKSLAQMNINERLTYWVISSKPTGKRA